MTYLLNRSQTWGFLTRLFIDYPHTLKKGVTTIASIIADWSRNLIVVVLSHRLKILKTNIEKHMRSVPSKSPTDKWLIFGPGNVCTVSETQWITVSTRQA